MPRRFRAEVALAVVVIAIGPVTCTPNFSDCVIRCGNDGSCPNGLSCSNGFCTKHGVCDDRSAGAGRAGAAGSMQADGGREAGGASGGSGNRGQPTASGGAGGTHLDASLEARADVADAHDRRDASLDAADSSTEKPRDYRFADRTGTITINVRACAPVVVTNAGGADCYPPDDFVLIGGGAEILDDPDDPGAGALLSRSSPSPFCEYWAAAWFVLDPDHPRRGRAYSIGIRLESRARPGTYIKAEELASIRLCDSHRYLADGATYSSLPPPTTHLLVGGGVANTESPPHVAVVQSYPSGRTWSAKGVSIDTDARVQVREIRINTIALPSSIPDFGNLETQLQELTVGCGTGHVCASANPFNSLGGVVTSVGGIARYGLSGRYLSALSPLVETNGHFTAGANMSTWDFLISDTRKEDLDVKNQSALLVLLKTN